MFCYSFLSTIFLVISFFSEILFNNNAFIIKILIYLTVNFMVFLICYVLVTTRYFKTRI